MLYIHKLSDNTWQKVSAIYEIHGGGYLRLPDELEAKFDQYFPFVILTLDGDEITDVQDDKAARFASIPTPQEKLRIARSNAMARIDGKCTAAIYNGYTVHGVRYYFTERAQNDWNGAMIQVLNGATSVSVKIDGAWVVYTADQVKEICGVMKDIIYIMRMYNQQLEAWIARETEEAVLSAIQFGSKLPDDLTKAFQNDATKAGVDLTKYASLLA